MAVLAPGCMHDELGERGMSLSVMARASVIGIPPGRKYPQTNGWIFWQFVDVNGSVKPLDVLRQRYYSRDASTSA